MNLPFLNLHFPRWAFTNAPFYISKITIDPLSTTCVHRCCRRKYLRRKTSVRLKTILYGILKLFYLPALV